MSVAHKVRLADGTNGVYKPISGETQASWDAIPYRGFASREVAASRLNEDLRFGLVPATAFWDGHEGRGSLQAFAANARAADGRLQNYPREQRERMAVFDYITGNGDRNDANYLVGQNGRLIAIDHGWTFPESTHFTIRSDFVAEFYRQPLSDRTRELLASVNLGHVRRRLLAAGLSGQAVGGALNRLAELRTHGRITGEAWGGQITDVEWKPVQAGGGR